jgi:thiol-disulfide isomerase/thioredoxin
MNRPVHRTRREALARAAALAWGGIAASPLPARAAPANPGERVVWPVVSLLDGRRWGPPQAQGRAVVVVFWSLTCPFCLRHNAHVSKLQASLGDAPLDIITAVREPDAEATRRHMAQHGFRFAVTLDAPLLAAALTTRRISPLTVTVDRQGRLKQVIPGEMFEDDVLGLNRLAQE